MSYLYTTNSAKFYKSAFGEITSEQLRGKPQNCVIVQSYKTDIEKNPGRCNC